MFDGLLQAVGVGRGKGGARHDLPEVSEGGSALHERVFGLLPCFGAHLGEAEGVELVGRGTVDLVVKKHGVVGNRELCSFGDGAAVAEDVVASGLAFHGTCYEERAT